MRNGDGLINTKNVCPVCVGVVLKNTFVRFCSQSVYAVRLQRTEMISVCFCSKIILN